MNNIIAAIVLGLAGAILGVMIIPLVQKIIIYKYPQKQAAFEKLFTSGIIKWFAFILNSLLWVLAGYKLESVIVAILISILFYLAILITIIDIQIRIIPNQLVIFMLATGLLFQFLHFGFLALIFAVLTMIAMMILFTVVACFVGFGKVGAGDVKLAGAMGLALGYPNIITALIIMSAVLIVFTAIGLVSKKLMLKSMVPFAPFMMSGMIFALVYITLGLSLLV